MKIIRQTNKRSTANATLQWSARNRLIKVIKNDGTILEMRYDYQGRRMQKSVTTTGATTTTFWIYNGYKAIAEYQRANATSGSTSAPALTKTFLCDPEVPGTV